MDKRSIRYCTERDRETGEEIVLGKQGGINVVDGEIVILCGAKEVFRCDADAAKAGELMSLAGVTVAGFDPKAGRVRSVVAYYQYHR